MTIAFIPARCGSKSIRFKNIKPFNGKPLIYWNLSALQNCDAVDEVVVATDCDKIGNVISEFKFSKVTIYRRNEENAEDTSSTESVMLEYLQKASRPGEDIFMLVQCTSPFTTSQDFENALRQYSEAGYDSLLSAVRIKRFFWNPSGTSVNYDYRHRPRRQDFDGELMENGAFYINRVKNILSSKNRLSGNIGFYILPEYTALELDEPEDWVFGEILMSKYHQPPEREIKIVLSDLDGVLTDGGVYYGIEGEQLVKFNRQDGKGFELLRNNNIKTGIITSEDTALNAKRMEKLNLIYYIKGEKKKLEAVSKILAKENLQWHQLAYIGDDINDLEVLQKAGFSACPANAVKAVKAIPGILHLAKKGGEGAFREFVEHICHQ